VRGEVLEPAEIDPRLENGERGPLVGATQSLERQNLHGVVCLLDRAQTRARVWSCAPSPAGGQSAGGCWSEGRTAHNGTARARRPGRPVCNGRHPFEPDGRERQGGGWQSGAAGEMPPAKRFFADRLRDDERQKPTANQPAEVAMGRRDSYTARPDGNAARHTDARSLAIPVSRGTMIPSAAMNRELPAVAASSKRRIAVSRGRLRRTMSRVYAAAHRVRMFFQRLNAEARGVPNSHGRRWNPSCGLKTQVGVRPADGGLGRNDRWAWHNLAGGGGRDGSFYSRGQRRLNQPIPGRTVI
jgi:hypothetical protein